MITIANSGDMDWHVSWIRFGLAFMVLQNAVACDTAVFWPQ